MKVLKKLIQINKRYIILSFMISFATVAARLIWTLNIGRLMDCIVDKKEVSSAFLITMAVLLIISAGMLYLNRLVSQFTAEKMSHTLRMKFADQILTRTAQGMNNETIQKTNGNYEALSKVQNELLTASEYISNTLSNVVWMTLSALFTIVFLLMQNVILTLTLLIPIVIITWVVRCQGKKLVPLVNKAMDGKIRHNKVAYSFLQNTDNLTLFDGKQFLRDKYTEELDNWGKDEIKKERVSAICNSLSGIMSQIPLLLLFAVGGILIWNNRITFGLLMVFLSMQSGVLTTLMNLPTWMVSIKSFLVHLERTQIQ